MNLTQAISKHIEWKVKFMSTILKHESMDTEIISKIIVVSSENGYTKMGRHNSEI
jgi:hypothetical protein